MWLNFITSDLYSENSDLKKLSLQNQRPLIIFLHEDLCLTCTSPCCKRLIFRHLLACKLNNFLKQNLNWKKNEIDSKLASRFLIEDLNLTDSRPMIDNNFNQNGQRGGSKDMIDLHYYIPIMTLSYAGSWEFINKKNPINVLWNMNVEILIFWIAIWFLWWKFRTSRISSIWKFSRIGWWDFFRVLWWRV